VLLPNQGKFLNSVVSLSALSQVIIVCAEQIFPKITNNKKKIFFIYLVFKNCDL